MVSFVPLTEKLPAHSSTNSTAELTQTTRDAYLMGYDPRQPLPSYKRGGWWNPMNWALWKRLVALAVIIIILIAIIVGAVLGSRANRYPSYSKLNYSLKDTFSGDSFFDNFDYFTGYDPTQGFVHYDDAAGAVQRNLTYISTGTSPQAVLRVDTAETNASTGRHSARITSKNTYNSGLFLFDIVHSPYGCATWPSIWLTDPSNWPLHGEIDVLESVNNATSGNQMTLHTTDGCTMQGVKREQTGTVLETSCVNNTDNNSGCGVRGAPATYGAEFNAAGGGVYAMELRSDGIRTWFFARSSIPSDIPTSTSNSSSSSASTTPDPSSWGTALADFPSTDCDVGTHFANLSIIVDVDLCGTWAGATSVYSGQDGCPGTCEDLVANNATAFEQAYWGINSFRVYQAS